ncbi:hypothetical protein IEQ34_022782 [Dendrobium chrysotoxum]|uniref:Avr9/Cf-9 rapidly elicited protein 146 n=1 Tax=Dendrobium chrysotoxum TaxID=161865 RepID=A0AAV7FZZ4_DENCH|nr:hypothetical protein IEQ34_022782 [Dendrobium chrysotoxum]
MLRKGLSKRKVLLDLHLLRKRGKIAGKALGNLLMAFHHHHHHSPINLKEVEFSCSNTPSSAYNYFHAITKRKNRRHCHHNDFDSFDATEFAMAFQMMNMEDLDAVSSTLPTPSPMMVRQLRITDSPFPMNENEVRDAGRINEEADKFIKKFYEQLLMQQLASKDATPDHYSYCHRSR